MVILSKLDLVHQFESILQALYVFFAHSSKKFLEFKKLVELITTKGNKLFNNMKTC
jgi:hypothetical protein